MLRGKVYLVTRRAGYNFGSSLQAYALQQIFLHKGCNCEILDVKEMRFRGRMRIAMLNLIGLIASIVPILKHIIGSRRYNRIVQSYKQRQKFDEFNNKTLIVSKRLHDNRALQRYIGAGNLIVCGSDQIWNPLSFNPIMALSFANSDKNRLAAYAPSFGVQEILTRRDEIAYYINRIEYLSIREETGALLLKELIGRDVPVLLDPTLVVNRDVWNNIEKPIKLRDQEYILCYFLQTDIIPHDYILDLANQSHTTIINVQTNYSACIINGADNRSDIGPGEFLYLLRHARYVITNSFHCCIFSHIYNKDFRVFSRFASTDKANQNSRIEMLLGIFGEQDRWINRSPQINNKEYVSEENMRHRSLRFIEEIIS